MRAGIKNERIAGWLWLACLLGLLGGWDLNAKVPSSCLGGKALPPGCAWNLNNNNGTATSFTVDNLNQLTAGPTSPYTNDNNGNLTSQVNYYAYGYSYDDEDQLTSVIFSGISKSDFKYDGLGRLRQRQEYTWSGGWYLSSTVNYVYDGRRVIQERDGNNTPTVSYTRGTDMAGSLEGAGGIGGLLARSHGYSGGSWTTHNYYHADGGGNITYMMNAGQTMAATYKYDPFGITLAQSGTLASANVYRFSSKEFHSASSLYYYGFRFYDPNLQRWLNRDPMGENGGINLYAFTGNDLLDFIDPFGFKGYRDSQWFGCIQKAVWLGEEVIDGVWNAAMVTAFTPPSGNSRDVITYLGNPLLRLGAYNPSSGKEVADNLVADLAEPIQSLLLTSGAGSRSNAGVKCQTSKGQAAKTGAGEMTSLYRAVSPAEYEQLMKSGTFQAGPNSLGGKFFAESAAHASQWGTKMDGAGNCKVIEAQFPKNAADSFMRWDKLDGIGPARYGELGPINAAKPVNKPVP